MKKGKTRKLTRRILSIVLTVVLMVGLMPGNILTVSAEGTDTVISDELIVESVSSNDASATTECTCGTDDPAFHATNCPAYIAPENPQCFCAEKCTDDTLNVWCDVCGMQGVSACQGEDTAVTYDAATPDFSAAKVLTAVDGVPCVDGVALEINTDQFGYTNVIIPEGNYKLTGDIATDTNIRTEGSINLDLNGYTWDMSAKCLLITSNVTLSLYDTSVNKTGKITSSIVSTIYLNGSGSTFNLYSGTVENTSNEVSAYGVSSDYGSSNLYGGKIKSDAYAVFYYLHQDITINIDNTSFDCGDGYAQISATLSQYYEPCAVIDVSDYEGGALTVDAKIDKAGKIKIFTGIQSAQDAENYKINFICDDDNDFFEEKQEYEADGGNKYVYVSVPSFTTQPTEENDYTVAFNRPDATLQWCEKTVCDSATYSEEDGDYDKLYEVNAGDTLIVSLSECLDDFGVTFDCSYNEESLYIMSLDSSRKTASVTFDSEGTVDVYCMPSPYGTGEYKIEHVRYTELEGETNVQLSKTECETTYVCKATVGETVYYSDEVTIEHSYTCTATSDNVITKECANCGKSGTLTIEAEDGAYDGTTAYGATVEKTGILENEEVTVDYYQGDTSIGTDAPVDEGTYTAKITYEEVTASVEFTINHVDADNNGYCDGCGAIYDGIGAHLAGYSVSLNGSIGVNFHMDLTQDVLDDNEAYMLFTLPNGTTQKVMVSVAKAKESAVIEGKTYYIFTCNVAAKEMTDTIQAQLITSDGSKTQVYEYSVREYADRILSGSYDAETKELVKAMLHYGAYSQEWFDYNTTNLANAGLDTLDLSEANDWDEFNPIITNDEKVGSFTSAYLTLESDTAINLKFKLADGVSFEDLRVVVQDPMGNVVPATIDTTENVCLITLTGIKASDLDTMYDFSVTDKEGNESAILYSAMSYARAVANSEMDQKLKDVTAALRIFNLRANEKFEY